MPIKLEASDPNTPGTAGGRCGRDRTLAVKRRETLENQLFLIKKIITYIYLQVMPKYWGKQIFSLGSFPEVGQKQKAEKKKKKKERPKVCNNNGQLRIANVSLRIGGGAHFYYLFKEFF